MEVIVVYSNNTHYGFDRKTHQAKWDYKYDYVFWTLAIAKTQNGNYLIFYVVVISYNLLDVIFDDTIHRARFWCINSFSFYLEKILNVFICVARNKFHCAFIAFIRHQTSSVLYTHFHAMAYYLWVCREMFIYEVLSLHFSRNTILF